MRMNIQYLPPPQAMAVLPVRLGRTLWRPHWTHKSLAEHLMSDRAKMPPTWLRKALGPR